MFHMKAAAVLQRVNRDGNVAYTQKGFQPKSVVVAGGVAASPELRRQSTRVSGTKESVYALPIAPDLSMRE